MKTVVLVVVTAVEEEVLEEGAGACCSAEAPVLAAAVTTSTARSDMVPAAMHMANSLVSRQAVDIRQAVWAWLKATFFEHSQEVVGQGGGWHDDLRDARGRVGGGTQGGGVGERGRRLACAPAVAPP